MTFFWRCLKLKCQKVGSELVILFQRKVHSFQMSREYYFDRFWPSLAIDDQKSFSVRYLCDFLKRRTDDIKDALVRLVRCKEGGQEVTVEMVAKARNYSASAGGYDVQSLFCSFRLGPRRTPSCGAAVGEERCQGDYRRFSI